MTSLGQSRSPPFEGPRVSTDLAMSVPSGGQVITGRPVGYTVLDVVLSISGESMSFQRCPTPRLTQVHRSGWNPHEPTDPIVQTSPFRCGGSCGTFVETGRPEFVRFLGILAQCPAVRTTGFPSSHPENPVEQAPARSRLARYPAPPTSRSWRKVELLDTELTTTFRTSRSLRLGLSSSRRGEASLRTVGVHSDMASATEEYPSEICRVRHGRGGDERSPAECCRCCQRQRTLYSLARSCLSVLRVTC